MKQLFIFIINFCITRIPVSVRVRDILIWPLASRVLGRNYAALLQMRAGFSLHGYMEDQLGRFAIFYGPSERYFWEPVTMMLLEKLVKNAHEVIIAGSHIGVTALYARNAMKEEGSRVHTFEPIAKLYEISKANLEVNAHLGEVVLTRKALGDSDSNVTMTQDRIRSRIINTETHVANVETEQVPLTTIDSYAKEKHITSLDLVLLDVEGYELNALKGMAETLAVNAPTDIIYEISFPKKDNLEAAHTIETYLAPFGYTFYIIEDPHDPIERRAQSKKAPLMVPVVADTYEAHIHRRYFNVFATRRSSEETRQLFSSVGSRA